MSFDSYTSFKASLESYADNDDVAAVSDVLIAAAHARLNRSVRIEEMVVIATAETIGGDAWLGKPPGYRGARRLKATYGNGQVTGLDYTTLANMDDTTDYNQQGRPVVYTVLGDRIRLGPIPNAVITVEIAYYKEVETLSATVTTNAFLTQCPDLLLYACLTEAGIWMRDPEMQAVWENQYANRLAEVIAEVEEGSFPDGALAMVAQ